MKNITLMRKVLAYIKKNPHLYNQNVNPNENAGKFCFLGLTLLLSGEWNPSFTMGHPEVYDKTSKLLGITPYEASILGNGSNSLEGIEKMIDRWDTPTWDLVRAAYFEGTSLGQEDYEKWIAQWRK